MLQQVFVLNVFLLWSLFAGSWRNASVCWQAAESSPTKGREFSKVSASGIKHNSGEKRFLTEQTATQPALCSDLRGVLLILLNLFGHLHWLIGQFRKIKTSTYNPCAQPLQPSTTSLLIFFPKTCNNCLVWVFWLSHNAEVGTWFLWILCCCTCVSVMLLSLFSFLQETSLTLHFHYRLNSCIFIIVSVAVIYYYYYYS